MTNSDKKQPLRELLKTSLSYAPTEVDLEKGCEVLDFLSKALLGEDYRTTTSSAFPSLKLHYSTNRSITLGIIPLDFYAWKLWRPDEPIACCVAGSISRTTFHAVARGKFRLLSDAITIEQGDKSEGTFNLQISSIKIQLRYHPNPLICRWSGVNNTGVAEVKSEMPWQSQERLSELERTQEIADQLSFYGADIVSKSYFIYQRWAKNLGFYPFTLTREHILAMAAYGLYASLTPHQMITLDIPFPDESYTLSETGNDLGLQVSKIKEPAWKMMFAFVELSRHLLREDASVMLDFSVLQWPVFFHLWSNFIRIDISYWGSSRVTVSKYLQAVETTIRLSTLKDLRKIEHEMVFHLWPHPFQAQKETPWMDEADSTERFNKKYLHLLKTAIERNPYIETEAEARESPNLELTYFIGYDNGTGLMEEMPSTMAFLSKAFKDALDSEDTSCSFSQLSNVTGPDLAPIYVPFIPWPTAIPEDVRNLPPDETDSEIREDPLPSSPPLPETKKSKSKSRSKATTTLDSPPSTSSSTFLRPAFDVLHRIRHDSTYKTDDIVIGYLDRHTGIKEIPFDWWTAEKTAEDFIPQSRIRYFKRKNDVGKLWDRDGRVDLVFGTGKQEG